MFQQVVRDCPKRRPNTYIQLKFRETGSKTWQIMSYTCKDLMEIKASRCGTLCLFLYGVPVNCQPHYTVSQWPYPQGKTRWHWQGHCPSQPGESKTCIMRRSYTKCQLSDKITAVLHADPVYANWLEVTALVLGHWCFLEIFCNWTNQK